MNDLVVVQEAKRSKDRSPTFPFITLERAIERARQFYGEEKRGIAPYSRAVLHWGYSESSSGALQTVAALKNYGLLSEPAMPGAKGRHLQLSEVALRIILDQRPDSLERDGYVRSAAMAPAVAGEVYAKWSESLPSDATLNHFLVLDKKFTEETAAKATKILKQNHAFARIGANDVGSKEEDSEGDEEMEAVAQVARVPKQDWKVPEERTQVAAPIAKAQVVAAPQLGGHTEQHLLRSGITVTIHFSSMPTADTYKSIGRVMAFKGDDFAEQAPPPVIPAD